MTDTPTPTPTPTMRDEVQVRLDDIEAELAELRAALDSEHVGDVKSPPPVEQVQPEPEPDNSDPAELARRQLADAAVAAGSEPPAGSPATLDDIAAARSAPPAPVPVPAALYDTAEPGEPGDGDVAAPDAHPEPPHGTPAEPADIAAARMAPPAPVVVPPVQ